LSGLYNSYRGLGGAVAPLVQSQWGILLDLKLTLVCIAIAMGAANRQTLRRNRSLSSTQTFRMARILRAEAVVMLLILLVSGWLANSAPANSL